MGVFNSDVKEIKIIWDKNSGRPFLAGEEVSGKAVIITEKDDVKIQKATIEFYGWISILFTERIKKTTGTGENKKTKMVKVDRKQHHEIFQETVELVSSGETVLENGDNEYPFSITLPEDAQSSFQWSSFGGGDHASVTYTAEVHADVPWGKDQRKKVELFVQAANDLNAEMETLESVCEEKMKTFGCLCCESGPLNLKVMLNKQGFVPGEYIDIKAEVNNKSDKRIGGVYVILRQDLVFKATGEGLSTRTEIDKSLKNANKIDRPLASYNFYKKALTRCIPFSIRKPSEPLIMSKPLTASKDDADNNDDGDEGNEEEKAGEEADEEEGEEPEPQKEATAKQSLGVVEPGGEELFEHCLKVPQLPPTLFDPYAISIEYFLEFAADPDGAGFDLDLPPIPITIGTIPHKIVMANFEPAPVTDDNDGGPNEDSESAIVSLPQKLQEKYPKLPGVLRGTACTGIRSNRSRWVSYLEYCCKQQETAKKKKKKQEKK